MLAAVGGAVWTLAAVGGAAWMLAAVGGAAWMLAAVGGAAWMLAAVGGAAWMLAAAVDETVAVSALRSICPYYLRNHVDCTAVPSPAVAFSAEAYTGPVSCPASATSLAALEPPSLQRM